MILRVAKEFHKLPHEVEDMPAQDFDDILLYLKLEYEETEKARKQSESKRRLNK